jgi:hypothetical protein
MTTHFVCTGGCGGVSDEAGTCQMQDCMKYHAPLTACHCQTGKHEEAFSNPNNTRPEQGTHEE